MAEAVQYHLERMVGELEDLERHQVFTKSELRQLVKKRTSFEYTLKRRRAQPVDYLRYIRYELNVDRLRRLRDQRRTQPDHTTTRVVSIFERLLARHNKADLWTQYIGFLMQRNNKRLLSKAFARAIVAHPRVTRLWIMAARYQLEQMAGSAARRLLQRALRVNPEAKDVWLEYFKLELHLVEKIRMRRRVLGIDKDGGGENENEAEDGGEGDGSEDSIEVPELPEEAGSVFKQIEELVERRQLAIQPQSAAPALMATENNPALQGAIPRIVFEQAIKVHPTDLSFRIDFAAALRGYPSMQHNHTLVLDSIERDFADCPRAQGFLCTQHITNAVSSELADQLREAVQRFSRVLAQLNTPEMWLEYFEFLDRWHRVCEENAVDALVRYLETLKRRMAKECPLNEDLANAVAPLMDGEWLAQMIERFPTSAGLWRRLLSTTTDNGLFDRALAKCPKVEILAMYLDWLEQQHDGKDIEEKYVSVARSAQTAPLRALAQIRFAEWAHRQGRLCEVYRTVENATSEFLHKCTELIGDSVVLVELHERLCMSARQVDPWLRYLGFLIAGRRLEDAARVFWRASNCVDPESLPEFTGAYQKLLLSK